ALAASQPFTQVETGFAGTASDGVAELDGHGSLTTAIERGGPPDASNGNVTQTVQVRGDSATVALGFGASEHSALGAALTASAQPWNTTYRAHQAGWQAYDARLRPPSSFGHRKVTAAEEKAYYLSANVIKASEDKTFAGATAASLASPWG